MIYFLYGVDTFRSRRKLREIIDAYRAKAGSSFNFHRFDGEDGDFGRLPSIAGSGSLFGGAKKMVVIERPFASARHFSLVRDVLKNLSGDTQTLVVLWDGAIAGDAKKMLAEIEPLVQKIQAFDVLAGDKLVRWIRREAVSRGFDFSSPQVSRLAAMGGDGLWAMNNEMEKMAVAIALKDEGQKTKGADATVFQLGDAFFTHPKAAVGFLLSLVDRGEDEMRVFSYLAGSSRTALVVKSYLDNGRPVGASHKLHPFVVKKTTAAVRTIPVSSLVRRLALFLDADIKIKTGLARPVDALMRILTSQLTSLP